MCKPHVLILIVCLVSITACSKPVTTPASIAQAPTLAPTAAPVVAPSATPTARPTDPPSPKATTPPTATPTSLPPTATRTQTVAPTATSSPSPTPAPAASVTGDSINVRGGPGTVYPIVGQAKKGEALPVLSRTQDGAWLEVTLADGKQGWVSAKLVTLNVSAESLPIAKAIPPTPKAPPAPALVTVGALSNLRMIAAGGPTNPGQVAFPAGVSSVWCAFEVDGAKLQEGDAYTLNLVSPTGASLLTASLLGPNKKIYQGTMMLFGPKGDMRYFAVPIYAPGGSFANGSYRSEIQLNGQVRTSISWTVGA